MTGSLIRKFIQEQVISGDVGVDYSKCFTPRKTVKKQIKTYEKKRKVFNFHLGRCNNSYPLIFKACAENGLDLL